jgi:hypothetical protein
MFLTSKTGAPRLVARTIREPVDCQTKSSERDGPASAVGKARSGISPKDCTQLHRNSGPSLEVTTRES